MSSYIILINIFISIYLFIIACFLKYHWKKKNVCLKINKNLGNTNFTLKEIKKLNMSFVKKRK